MDPITQQIALASAGATAGEGLYVDDVFSTDLYEGTGSSLTITNGIDLAGESGIIWDKNRDTYSDHRIIDVEANAILSTSLTNAKLNGSVNISSYITYNNDGWTSPSDSSGQNTSGNSHVAWTFRQAPGFFDVVTYTGDGTNDRNISHSLGSTPGALIIKRLDSSADWLVWHRSAGISNILRLNLTNEGSGGLGSSIPSNPTSSVFTVSSNSKANASGGTYVAYLFAHDDQSFGTGSDEAIIKCGGYTGNGTSTEINLEFEPQWVMVKGVSDITSWAIFDVMRGFNASGSGTYLRANTGSNESSSSANYLECTSTGFKAVGSGGDYNFNGDDYVYIAIRRPHKPPELATDVFDVNVETEARTTSGWTSLSGFVTDAFMNSRNLSSEKYTRLSARLTGGRFMYPDSTSTEGTTVYYGYDTNDGIKEGTSTLVSSSDKNIDYHFRRAPGFFDVVAYSGASSAQNIPHDLGVKPEMIITKVRTTTDTWAVQHAALGATYRIRLNFDFEAGTNSGYWNDTEPTASVFTVGTDTATGGSGNTYIGYLFATLPGISKVGSYSGTGGNIDVDCGFSAGARFVLIKRSDSTGDWYVWDSTRGIVSGNDPYIELNTTDTEVTNTDYLDPLGAGFTVTSAAPAALNASGGTYLFLAIA